MKYINVVIDNKSEYTDSFFTYRAPDDVCVGDKVQVSFARRKKPVDGYVFQELADAPDFRVKDIESVDKVRSLNAEMVDTAGWMRKRYGIKFIDAIKMFTVGGKRLSKDKIIKAPESLEEFHTLTPDQENAVARINESIDEGAHKVFLLKGVTNSGKTEVFINAVEKALSMGKSAIVLVPEIALAAQTERRFKARFGEDNVAIMHSKLTTSKRLEEWVRIKNGEARVVIGARTAVFAPVDNLGVIVIDEEHEATYKSDHNPKYETVDIAYRRTQYHGAALVLGSATPSITSYHRAKSGLYELLEMKHRIGVSRMPSIEIADMKQEIRRGNQGVLSERLKIELSECLARGEQAILFLNRRGFSTQIICPECGYRYVCDTCGISLTYHKASNAAVCHYCDRKYPLISSCPECGSKHLKYSGTGTEKVEEKISELFPNARVDRFDLDTAKSQKEIDRVISDFQKHKTNILVGTQILAKGLDFQNVGLVGVVLADVTLNIPDYRSPERTYQLITQVAGRAGRNSGNSKVVIQTYLPEDDSIRFAAANDYESFYESELLHRNIMNYPPFSDIIAVSFVEKEEHKDSDPSTMAYAMDFHDKLKKMSNAPEGAVIYKPREEYRKGSEEKNKVTFLIKAPKGSRSGYIRAYMNYRDKLMENRAKVHIEIDVNPYGSV